ncbi:MAG: hypothetical protein A2Y34_08825 [Spirochaetes bacterium GWC1_27_15]|nr:MAG: hypothetical protein A2Y34_08825 [Spirochaetes bacterium GWC1_27_15]
MNNDEILIGINKVLSDLNKIEIEEIEVDENLMEIGINSLDLIKVIINLEKYFNIKFDSNLLGVNNFNSINKIISQIETSVKL